MNKFIKYSIIPIVIVSVIIPTLLILDNIDNNQDLVIPADLLRVLESCNDDSDFNPSMGISYSNGTHYIDDAECEWYKNLETKLDFVELEESEDEYLKELHPKIIINLVNGLTQNYDLKGLENLRGANYIAHLSGSVDGSRYLYIYDPDTNQFVGKHDDHPVGEFFITEINLEEGQSMWETFTKDKIPSPYDVYFKKHDSLIFASYYKAD